MESKEPDQNEAPKIEDPDNKPEESTDELTPTEELKGPPGGGEGISAE